MKRDIQFYNEARKNKFILDSCVKRDENGNCVVKEDGSYDYISKDNYLKIRATLRKVAEYEFKYNKDFCEIKKDQDDDFLADLYTKLFPSLSYYSSKVYHIILKRYIEWCRNEGIITTSECWDHPFFKNRIDDWKTNTDFRSPRVKNQLEYLMEEKTNTGNYVFGTKQDLFECINEVFGAEKNIMDAAIYSLLYYGFNMNEIRLIRRVDVNTQDQKVCGKAIDNNTAFDLIQRAKVANSYTIQTNGGSYEKTYFYVDSIYLIRSNRKASANTPITTGYIRDLSNRSKKLIAELPYDSKYKNKNIKITVATICKTKYFHDVLSDEEKYGLEIVLKNFRAHKYSTFNYREYQAMKLLVEKQ